MAKSILLIEDNKGMRENIAEILELANYEVSTAENGKIGVKQAKLLLPDLIICDIMMPEMDGYETLYMLGKDKRTSQIPFIFLTAKSEKTDWRKGMNMGADDYLTKPFDEMELLNAVEVRLQKSERLSQELNDKLEHSNHFIYKSLGMEKLRALAENKKSKVYKKKEIIFHEGDYVGSVFYVLQGKIKTYKSNLDSKDYTLDLYRKGDFIGYKALIKEMEHFNSAVALEDSTLVRIKKEEFLNLLYENPDVSKVFNKLLSGKLMEKEQELINLAFNSVRKRAADALLLLEKKYKEEDESPFCMSISRDDLASLVGTSTESVIRALSDFKDEALIEVKGSKITLLDSDGLKSLRQ
ncbi:MAG: response regulator [Flavobacteriales bacterium]